MRPILRRIVATLSASAALLLPTPSPSQVVSRSLQVVAAPPSAGGELPSSVFASPSGATGAGATATPGTTRLDKIRQLHFDRRPSAVLEAWSNPDGAGPTPKETPATLGATTPPQPSPDPFDKELTAFRRDVTLGRWSEVKGFLATLPGDEGKAAYARLLESLAQGPGTMPGGASMPTPMPAMPQFQEKNAISAADVIALAGASPSDLDEALVASLGRLLRVALERGNTIEDAVALLKAEAEKPAGVQALSRRQAARLLTDAGRAGAAGPFLPSIEQAETENDREALNLLARHFLALHADEKKTAHLEQAWQATQAALAVGEVSKGQKDEAIRRSVELAPKVREDLGEAWLSASFADRPERGREILAAIGSAASRGLQTHPMDPDARKKGLELQKTAVEALLAASPGRASEWRESLALLASAWLSEAEFSRQFDRTTGLGPRLRRDPFGNIFFVNDDMSGEMMQQQNNMPRAIAVADVLENRPGAAWLALLDDGYRPRFASACAQLYLKAGDDARALPFIEQVAAAQPDAAGDLVEELLRVWSRAHDPNADRNMTNQYMFMFGFERRAESIPLTRSKQERNLRDLAELVRRLRALPIGELDEALVARAFTASHSTAEVYRVEAIEGVFGPLGGLKPETLAELAQQMRANLVGVWRQPAVQEQNKTRRKEKDIRAEVLRGYEVARAVLDRGVAEHPDHWGLVLARAALSHDENNYRQEIELSPAFAATRQASLDEFRRAATLYAEAVPSLSEEKEDTKVFEQWFYAGLGASDLAQIDEETQPDLRQPPMIREAILALPGEAAERHLAKFANNLFTHMSAAKPSVKYRYLRAGFEIVGDHKRAVEARKVFDYYKDLVTELKLETALDGDAEVGHGRPFGLFVRLRHTREIERESGGFGRYLQNQNQPGNMFFYNYGRPLENYRDKFEKAARKALEDHYEVLSITFQDEKVNSKATEEYGWRVTPYAYLLLKAREPKEDTIPPLRLDLDFLDTSGYVILPIESPALPLDASGDAPGPRPFAELKLTQTLDERQADEGKLVVEVKATARGLVPDLGEILDPTSEGFDLADIEDQGLSVSRFDPDSEETAVTSERTWLVSLRAPDGLPNRPEVFSFPTPKVEVVEAIYQRYDDADLVAVEPTVHLEEHYGRPSHAWAWWTAGGLAALIACGAFWQLRPRPTRAESDMLGIPDPLTPFTLLGLLRDIQHREGLSDETRHELSETIRGLEADYFARPSADGPDLRPIAEAWLRRRR